MSTRVLARASVLDAAQRIIDAHRSTTDCFGRCAACGQAWPCEPWIRAGASFTDASRLPRRAPAPPCEALPWSPVDWFGTGPDSETRGKVP